MTMSQSPSFVKATFLLMFLLATSLTSAFNMALLKNSNKKVWHNNSKNCCQYRYDRDCNPITPSLLHSHSTNDPNDEEFVIQPNYDDDGNTDDTTNNNNGNSKQPPKPNNSSRGRRAFFQRMMLTTSTPLLLLAGVPERANAQFVKFPSVNGLGNTYHFLRAGESLMEEEGIWSTNPLFLTNQESALSTPGIQQNEQACKMLKDRGIAPTIIRYSLAANAIATSDTVARQLLVGRDRNVPEFNLMDPRAIGMWDMSMKKTTEPAVWALDALEAGLYGMEGRPPANIDGTPHETLSDQTIRLRQLMSVLETQYSGDTILLIFPDGTGPALLTCLIGGIPLYRVHEFELQSGEAMLNVNYNSARALQNSIPSERYLKQLEVGKIELKRLLENPEDSMLDVKDKQYERERKLEEEKKKKLERDAALMREEGDRVKRERQAAEAAQRKEVDDEIRIKREAQLAEVAKQKEENIAKMKEKEKEQKYKREEQAAIMAQQREKEIKERDEDREKKIKQNADIAEKARLNEEEKKVKRNAEIVESARRKEVEKEELARRREIEKEESARRKEIESEYKMSKKAQLTEVQRQKDANNEPGGTDLLIGGGALISAGGAAYLFLQDGEDSEGESNVSTLERGGVEADEENKTAAESAKRLKEEEEVRWKAKEAARIQLEEEEARQKAKEKEAIRLQAEEEARLAAEEESRVKAVAVEAERLRVEEEVKYKAARLQVEEQARFLAEEEAKAAAKESKRLKAEEEAKRAAEEADRLKVEQEAKLKAEEEENTRLQAEEDARIKAEEEEVARVQAEEDARIKAEEEKAAAEEESRLAKMTKRERLTWNPDEDDGGLAWLDSLADMMNEGDDEKDEA